MDILQTTDLNSPIYQASLKIRKEVFIQEQNVAPEIEVDDLENQCTYYVGYVQNQPVVTTRVHHEEPNTWHLQRVATQATARHQGYASQLLSAIEAEARQQNVQTITLNAQDQAQNFYLQLGYEVVGPQFLDAGIKHHQMIKNL